MAFQLLVLLAGLVAGWLKKGSVWSITSVRLRVLWALPIAYILQHFSIAYLTGHFYEVALVVSYVLIIWFCYLNIRVPGILWTLGGTVCNFVVMAANGLRMPAYVPAVRHMAPKIVPMLMKGQYGKSIAMTSSSHLNFLGDIFSIEVQPMSIISIGDILFAIGLVILIRYGMTAGRSASPHVNTAAAP